MRRRYSKENPRFGSALGHKCTSEPGGVGRTDDGVDVVEEEDAGRGGAGAREEAPQQSLRLAQPLA